MDIDKTTYSLDKNNYYNNVFKKTQIVIGHSSRKDMRHFDSWVNRRNGTYKKTSPFTIDKEGKIYQHYDPKYYSDFLGCEQDKGNISITLVNEGWLRLNDMNIFVDWLGHTYSRESELVERSWRNKKYWKKYTNNQFESLKYLIDYLCDQFKIPKEIIGNNTYNEDIDIFKGITFRSNYFKDITDVSPAFEVEKII